MLTFIYIFAAVLVYMFFAGAMLVFIDKTRITETDMVAGFLTVFWPLTTITLLFLFGVGVFGSIIEDVYDQLFEKNKKEKS